MYEGNTYYYVKNALDDVESIVTEDGTTIVDYYYNAWGQVRAGRVNLQLDCDSADYKFANINPMRYRSYYYDEELAVYYLQSRYYDSSTCRFLNADLPEIAYLLKNEVNGTNAFSYCANNPVNNVDPSGFLVTEAAAGAAFWSVVSELGLFLSALFAPILIIVALITTITIALNTDFAKSKEQEKKDALKDIPNRLKTKDGSKVDIDKFNIPLKNGQGNSADKQWRIVDDRDGHGGSRWKLYKGKKRIASLKEDGTIVGK